MQAIKSQDYLISFVKVIATTITTINHRLAQAYSLMKSMKWIGEKGFQAAHKI